MTRGRDGLTAEERAITAAMSIACLTDRANGLREERATFECAYQGHASDPSYEPPDRWDGGGPCWKAMQGDDFLPEHAWCDSCQRRQVVYLALCDARRRLAAARLSLYRAGKALAKEPRP